MSSTKQEAPTIEIIGASTPSKGNKSNDNMDIAQNKCPFCDTELKEDADEFWCPNCLYITAKSILKFAFKVNRRARR